MAFLYQDASAASEYGVRNWVKQGRDPQVYLNLLATSTTLYVGNMSFYTTEEQVWELFSKVGEVKRIIMGLNQFTKTPCGFCFVEYFTHEAAMDCVNLINGTRLDDRIIRADWDTGFEEGRQYGRGRSGGQVRDDYRTEFDPERGGLSTAVVPQQQQHFRGGRDFDNRRRGGGGRGGRREQQHHGGGGARYQERGGNESFNEDIGADYKNRESRNRIPIAQRDESRKFNNDDRDRDRDRDRGDRYRDRDYRDRDRDYYRGDRERDHDRDRDRDYYDDRRSRGGRYNQEDSEKPRFPMKDAFGRDIPPPETMAPKRPRDDDGDTGYERGDAKRQKLE